jgi:hypothetical protein
MTGPPTRMRGTLAFAWRALTLCAVSASSVACGYGFGNHRFGDMRHTAIAFAEALQANDTVRMRQLSWGRVQDSAAAIAREVPRAYVQFSKPTPELVTTEGGGVYGGSVAAGFLVTSTEMRTCHGGVQLEVMILDKKPSVAAVRLVPPPDSLTDDACRAAVERLSSADFVRALRQGLLPGGVPIDSFMPFRATKDMNDTEIDALWAYLQTVPPQPMGK